MDSTPNHTEINARLIALETVVTALIGMLDTHHKEALTRVLHAAAAATGGHSGDDALINETRTELLKFCDPASAGS
jgi:hypothetical protein